MDDSLKAIPHLGRRIAANAAGVLAVLASAASALFALMPINPAANCYAPSHPVPVAGAIAIGCGLLALIGWVFLLTDRERHSPQIAACAAMAFVIVVIAVIPAIFATGAYGPTAAADREACGMTFVGIVLAGVSSVTSLVAASVVYLLARFLPRFRGSLIAAAAGGVLVWVGYVALIHPFW